MLSAACLLIVTSCKKDDKANYNAKGGCLIMESFLVQGDNIKKTTYTYNTEGEITNVKNQDEDQETIYTYSDSKISQVIKDRNFSATITYDLDVNGRIVSENYPGNYSRTFTYNDQGYLIETQRTINGNPSKIITKFSYTKGNLTSVNYGTYTVDYTYNEYLANDNFYSKSDYIGGIALKKHFGRTSKNLVSKYIDNYGKGTSSFRGYEEIYTYERDVFGNVAKVSVASNDNFNYAITAKYNCK